MSKLDGDKRRKSKVLPEHHEQYQKRGSALHLASRAKKSCG